MNILYLYRSYKVIGRDISHCLRRVMRYPPIEDIASLIERAYTIRDQIERRGKKQKFGFYLIRTYKHCDCIKMIIIKI